MLQWVVEIVIEGGLQAVGWAVLKAATAGRYQGFKAEDILFEGTVGFVTVVVCGYGIYRWIG